MIHETIAHTSQMPRKEGPMNLVVGATGILGTEICRLLAERDGEVRALVRETSSPDKIARLRSFDAELVRGDLKDASSLKAACRGVTAVITTASSTLSRQAGDSIESVDRDGQLALIDAAAAASVERFILISVAELAVDSPLQAAKRSVEDRLRRSGMTFTILQPTCFAEVWLSPALGFDLAQARARIYGDGINKTSWVSFRDVAQIAVASLDNSEATNATFELGGPEALSPLEVVRLAERMTGTTFEVEHVPEETLRAQYAAATNSLERSFAGLLLSVAAGDVIDMHKTLAKFPGQRLRSVHEYFEGLGIRI